MTAKASEVLFNSQTSVAPLGIIALEGAAELGKMIDRYLVSWAQKGGMILILFSLKTNARDLPQETERD